MNVTQHMAWLAVWQQAREMDNFLDFKEWAENGTLELSWTETLADVAEPEGIDVAHILRLRAAGAFDRPCKICKSSEHCTADCPIPEEPESDAWEVPAEITLSDEQRTTIFRALADSKFPGLSYQRRGRGVGFVLELEGMHAYGGLLPGVCEVLGVELISPDGMTAEHRNVANHTPDTEQLARIMEGWAPVFRPHGTEFGIYGKGKTVHARKSRATSTLCGRSVGTTWLGRSEASGPRCVRCNVVLDKRDGESK